MKAYVMTTGAVFGLLTLVHLLRIIVEGLHLAKGPVIRSHHRCRRKSMSLGLAPA